MNKCTNCDNSIDAKECSHCSAENSNKVCPHCGTANSNTAKFCNECGQQITSGACTKTQPKYFWIKLAPTLMFFVFALLLFAVYAEPIASIASVISASVYFMCDNEIINDSALQTISILLVILAVLTLIVAIAVALIKYLEYRNNKIISNKSDWISFGCYLLYVVLGIAICIFTANREYNGRDTYVVGACSVWLVILPIIFVCLLGVIHLYIKYNDTINVKVNSIKVNNIQSNQNCEYLKSIDISNEKEKDDGKSALSKNKESDGKSKLHRKKSLALLPSIFVLLIAVIMWGVYMLPFIRYVFEYTNDYEIFYINLFDLNFTYMGRAIVTFINIFQVLLITYLAIVTVAAVILLIWAIMRNKKSHVSNGIVCRKSLLITLILYSVFLIFTLALLLFTIIAFDTWFEIGCIVAVAVMVICVIGTIIAMVKIKKNSVKETVQNLD